MKLVRLGERVVVTQGLGPTRLVKMRLIGNERPRAYLDFDVTTELVADRAAFAFVLWSQRGLLRQWRDTNRASAPQRSGA